MPESPHNIAIIRTDRLGDMVLTLPMFVALRKRFPTAQLVLFARAYVQALVENIECIDEIVYTDAIDLRQALATANIDCAFFPRARASEVWAAFRAGVRYRIGTANRWYAFLYTTRIKEHRSRAEHHEAEYNVRMISHAFGPPIPDVHLVSPVAKRAPDNTIIIHPGSQGSSPRWSAKHFGEAAMQLQSALLQKEGTLPTMLVTGVEAERAFCDEVVAQCPTAVNACGQYDLSQLIERIASARMLIANATGTLHLAASLGVPVVGFYPNSTPVSARRWRPYATNARVLSTVPHPVTQANDDMSTITVDACVEAALALLGHQCD